jgi:hypothetical protein
LILNIRVLTEPGTIAPLLVIMTTNRKDRIIGGRPADA